MIEPISGMTCKTIKTFTAGMADSAYYNARPVYTLFFENYENSGTIFVQYNPRLSTVAGTF